MQRAYPLPAKLPRSIRTIIRRLAADEGRQAARQADNALREMLATHALDALAAGRDRADLLAELQAAASTPGADCWPG